MTVTLSWIGGVIGAVVSATIAYQFALVGPTTPNWVLYAILLGGGTLGLLVWVYSPLPDDNGGLAGSELQGRYWGFDPVSAGVVQWSHFLCRHCGEFQRLNRFGEEVERGTATPAPCEGCGDMLYWGDMVSEESFRERRDPPEYLLPRPPGRRKRAKSHSH